MKREKWMTVSFATMSEDDDLHLTVPTRQPIAPQTAEPSRQFWIVTGVIVCIYLLVGCASNSIADRPTASTKMTTALCVLSLAAVIVYVMCGLEMKPFAQPVANRRARSTALVAHFVLAVISIVVFFADPAPWPRYPVFCGLTVSTAVIVMTWAFVGRV